MISFDISVVTAWLWGGFIAAVSVLSAAHALLNKRDPRSAIGWISVCLFVPLVGAFFYFLLGVNRVRRRALKLRALADSPVDDGRYQVLGDGPVQVAPAPLDGNEIESYLNGPEAYDAMLAAIAGASESVWLSQYIFEKRGVGGDFIDALGAAASRGVKVRVLLDGVGALYSLGSTRRALRERGVEVSMFAPPRLIPFQWAANLRNHRKILVVDGVRAFTGGMNIRSGYLPAAPGEPADIHDCHFGFTGPIVQSIAAVFRDDWYLTTSTLLPLTAPGPVASDGPARCRVTVDGPDNRVDLLTLVVQTAVGKARDRVRVMTPYFLPPREIVSALQAAAVRGVAVEIVLPARNNLPFVHWATQHLLPQLLHYGVRVFYQRGSFDHSKLLRVDDDFSLVGSANIDPRSLRLNFEVVVEAWCGQLAGTIDSYFDARLADADLLEADTLLQANLLVFVEISLYSKSADIFDDFRRAAIKLPHVLECHLVSGDFDYLIKARISEMASYRKLLGDILLRLPGVRESKSYIVMEELKETLALPIPDAD